MASVDTSREPARIRSMFDRIANRYDLLNHLLSGGLDLYWRRRALAALDLSGREVLLDVCTGTADVAIGARRRPRGARRVIGIDFAAAMLARAREKIVRLDLAASVAVVSGDAMRLPIRTGTIDAVTVAFGIRNVSDPFAACGELRRVLRPLGQLAILEFAMPHQRFVAAVYGFYFRRILPRIGRIVSGHDAAYAYLPASVETFTPPRQFASMLEQAGFADVRAIPLTFGAVYLYRATVPAARPDGGFGDRKRPTRLV